MTVGILAVAAAMMVQPTPQDTLAIVDVRILDVETGLLSEPRAILVEDGVITWTGDPTHFTPPSGSRVVDAGGRTAVPGLVDAHAHTDSLSFSLFLANGVTSVREMNGAERHLSWRDAIRSGALLGPRLLVASELLAGIPFEGVRYRLVENTEDAREAAREAVEAGYDYLKVYDALSQDEYEAIVAEARGAGIGLTGHIPADVGLANVLEARQGLEHAEKIVNDVLGHDPQSLDPLREAVGSIAQAGVAVTPTLAVQEVLTETDPSVMARHREAEPLAYVSSGTRGWWSSLSVSGRRNTGEDSRPARYRRALRTLVALMAEEGVPVLAGTDTPNPYMVPGFSIHDELEALVRAGMTPGQALASATTVPGATLDFGEPLGRVAAGYGADFVIVDGNPIDDLRILREPWSVVSRGRWLDRAGLDHLLEGVRDARSGG